MTKALAVAAVLLAGCSASPAASPPAHPRVMFFLTADCPIANAFAPEINRIVADYQPRGVEFERIYTDLALTAEDLRRHGDLYGFAVPARLDAGHALCRKYGLEVTPAAVLVDAEGRRAYRGRIDDRYLAPGRYRLAPTSRDLRDAIEAVLAGRPAPVPETAAVGCPLTE